LSDLLVSAALLRSSGTICSTAADVKRGGVTQELDVRCDAKGKRKEKDRHTWLAYLMTIVETIDVQLDSW
jgi:hypothetical protein